MTKLSFSYSFLSQYDNCPEAARQLFILRTFKKSYTVAGGINDHEELDKRLKNKTPLPLSLSHAEPFVQALERTGSTESEVALAVNWKIEPVPFFSHDAFVRGKFDVVVRDGSRAFIGDWKTGKVRESDQQLEIGALLLMKNDPEIDTVTGVNIWLKIPKLGTPYKFTRLRSADDPLGESQRWGRLIKRIEAIEKKDAGKEWERREGPLCSYCPVSVCPKYRGG